MSNRKITITGSTTILHKNRVLLNLNMSEYVVMSFLAQLYKDKARLTKDIAMLYIGVELDQVLKVIDVLLSKNMVTKRAEAYYEPAKEWFKIHKEKGFEFGLFYQPIKINETKISWRSSSKDAAMKKLTLALAGTSIEVILYSKLRYFISKYETNSLDFIMGAERFVGPERNYLTEWALKPEGEDLLRNYIEEYYGELGQVCLLDMLPEKADPNEPVLQQRSIITNEELWRND